eukprot:COSAG02_NODE_1342_length_13169_cov_11.075905_1_plen_352_part_00
MAGLAKQGVATGLGKLHETEVGVLATLIRGCNVGVGLALVLGSGALTLWECIVELWLCNQLDPENRCMQSFSCDGATTIEEVAECALEDSSYVRCQLACGLGAVDVLSSVVIALFMFPLGGMLLAFEGTRASERGMMRAMLEEYFGFMLQYRGRMNGLLFSGVLALGNVTENLDGDDEIYHWGGLVAGVAAVATAILHLAVIFAHPEYDREMTVQQERVAAMRMQREAFYSAEHSSGAGQKQRSDMVRGAFSAAGDVVTGVAGRGNRRAAAPPADNVGERAAAAVEAARALSQSASSRGKSPPRALPSGSAMNGAKRQPPSLRTAAMAVRAGTPPRAQRKRPPPPLSGLRP